MFPTKITIQKNHSERQGSEAEIWEHKYLRNRTVENCQRKKIKRGGKMSVADREVEIIKLNEERLKLIKKIKSGIHPEHEQKYNRRIEEINKQIEELIKWSSF